jgi:hypothetical protein
MFDRTLQAPERLRLASNTEFRLLREASTQTAPCRSIESRHGTARAYGRKGAEGPEGAERSKGSDALFIPDDTDALNPYDKPARPISMTLDGCTEVKVDGQRS